MKRVLIIWTLIVLAVVGMAWAGVGQTPAGTVLRITDGIGRQYTCITVRVNDQGDLTSYVRIHYGFGGVGDTLAIDTTVSKGTLRNIKRVKESDDAGLSELLPVFISSRTQLDTAYFFSKWSSVCWGLNNYYASVGGLNGWQQARPDSGRFSPRFARVARANGIYLNPKAVDPPANNLGSGALTASTGAYTFSDSGAIDSTLYGAAAFGHLNILPTFTGTGTCTLTVFGSNQNLVHGRRAKVYLTQATTEATLTPDVATDSIYNIDSSKVKTYTGTVTGTILYNKEPERRDSL